MIKAHHWKGKKVAVLGLARSGMAAVKAFIAANTDVVAWDEKEELREAADLEGATIQNLLNISWDTIDGLFVSPGVPHHINQPHPMIEKALTAAVPILSDMDILYESVDNADFIGVTGTNGKSTTTALITHLLKTSGIAAQAGGNIGKAVLDLDPFLDTGIYVLELSSYQLEHIQKIEFQTSAILNIQSDHLDRHGNIRGYINAKKKIFDRVKTSKIINIDDHYCEKIMQEESLIFRQMVIPISCKKPDFPIRVENGFLIDDLLSPSTILDLKTTPTLFAKHNWQNALAAYAAVKYLSLDRSLLVQGFQSFPGLEHRQEQVLVHKGIHYINDSKATNLDSTLQALEAFDNIYWIAGGKPKETDFRRALIYSHKIRKVYAIGEAENTLFTSLHPELNLVKCGTLPQAFHQAKKDSQRDPEAVILFSPACASFDQFKDFEERGQVFKRLVKETIK